MPGKKSTQRSKQLIPLQCNFPSCSHRVLRAIQLLLFSLPRFIRSMHILWFCCRFSLVNGKRRKRKYRSVANIRFKYISHEYASLFMFSLSCNFYFPIFFFFVFCWNDEFCCLNFLQCFDDKTIPHNLWFINLLYFRAA